MASVIIDLGFGELANLSERTGPAIPSAKHRRDAENSCGAGHGHVQSKRRSATSGNPVST